MLVIKCHKIVQVWGLIVVHLLLLGHICAILKAHKIAFPVSATRQYISHVHSPTKHFPWHHSPTIHFPRPLFNHTFPIFTLQAYISHDTTPQRYISQDHYPTIHFPWHHSPTIHFPCSLPNHTFPMTPLPNHTFPITPLPNRTFPMTTTQPFISVIKNIYEVGTKWYLKWLNKMWQTVC